MEHRRSIFGPLFLIAAGTIWLLVKSGNIPVSNLWALSHAWPFLLIAAGIGVILRPYWRFTGLLLDVLIIGGLVLAIVFAPKLGWANPSMSFIFRNNDLHFGPTESGSGNVITQTRKVSGFQSIQVNYPAEVFISQGKTESLKIEAEDNVLPGLRTEVKNGALDIYYNVEEGKEVSPTKLVKITIVVKELQKVDFSSAGELTIDGLKTKELEISIDGAGKLKLNDLNADSLNINLNGAGNMTASGVANNLDLTISGFGSFDGSELHSQKGVVNLSGAGSATVWVDDSLDAEISGAGSVSYYGDATVDKNVNGVGSVKHLGSK